MSPIFIMLCIFCAVLFMGFAKGPAQALPTCRIKKGKKTLVVNLSDAAAWVKEGWKRVDDVLAPTADADDADDDEDDEDDPVALVNACKSHADLDALIEENGLELDLDDKATIPEKKAAILEAIE